MFSFISKILFGKVDKKIRDAKMEADLRGTLKKTELNKLKNINRKFKILIDEGSVEIIIKNVNGVLQNK